MKAFTLALLPMFLFIPGLVPTAHSQIFVANYGSSTIVEYATSGDTINASLITGLSRPYGLATDGTNLFVSNSSSAAPLGKYKLSGDTVDASLVPNVSGPLALEGNDLFVLSDTGTIGEYTTSGDTMNASLISLPGAHILALAVEGNDLFVTSTPLVPPVKIVQITIGEYTTSGTTENASLISFSSGIGSYALAAVGTDLFVANATTSTIGEYTNSGTLLSESLISGLNGPTALTVQGNDLFVANSGNGTIGQYTTSGDPINPTLISGLGPVYGLVAIPEPATLSLLSMTYGGLLLRQRRQAK